MLRHLLAVGLGLASFLAGCSMLIAPDELERGCPADQKACAGVCVSRADPEYGCDGADCYPCLIAQATARCNAQGACVVATCRGRFADCNADGDSEAGDGCETDTAHDPKHCGACDALVCQADHAEPACAGGRCALQRCDPGFHDCNGDAGDGCELKGEACP